MNLDPIIYSENLQINNKQTNHSKNVEDSSLRINSNNNEKTSYDNIQISNTGKENINLINIAKDAAYNLPEIREQNIINAKNSLKENKYYSKEVKKDIADKLINIWS